MDRKRRMKTKNSGGVWLYLRTRLGQLILMVCLSSVGLNVFLLFARNIDLQKRTEDGRSHIVFDHWAAGYNQEIETTVKKLYSTTTHLVLNNQSVSRKNHIHVLHTNLTQQKNKSSSRKLWKGVTQQLLKPTTHVVSANRSKQKCPLIPPGLIGAKRAMTDDQGPEMLRLLFTDMEKGGRIRPNKCVSRERMAIIIPFRNRHQHLHILLHNLVPFLQRQMADATIFIIEQAPGATFNRGALLNVGFIEAQKFAKFDCFLLHDVDLVPLNDRNLYRCGKNPRHYAVAMNKFGFRLMYEAYFGGVVGFSRQQYFRVNGNSNLYFGWGGEDDDLWQRIANKNYTVDRYDNITSRYLMVKHTRDKGNDKNSERRKLMKSVLQRQDVEGLNTTKYKVNSIELDKLYTWINVSLDMKEIIETAPEFTKRDIWKLLRDIKLGKLNR